MVQEHNSKRFTPLDRLGQCRVRHSVIPSFLWAYGYMYGCRASKGL